MQRILAQNAYYLIMSALKWVVSTCIGPWWWWWKLHIFIPWNDFIMPVFKRTIIVYIKNCSESSVIDIMYHISVSMAMHHCHLILLCIFSILCFCIVFELCSKRESNDIYRWDLLYVFWIPSAIIWVQLHQNSWECVFMQLQHIDWKRRHTLRHLSCNTQ